MQIFLQKHKRENYKDLISNMLKIFINGSDLFNFCNIHKYQPMYTVVNIFFLLQFCNVIEWMNMSAVIKLHLIEKKKVFSNLSDKISQTLVKIYQASDNVLLLLLPCVSVLASTTKMSLITHRLFNWETIAYLRDVHFLKISLI